jgi:hypothetical protein
MRVRTALATALLSMSLLACMGGDEELTAIGPVELTEPWAEMQLPAEEGVVQMSDARKLSVGYTGKSVLEVTETWYNAVQRVGFVQTAIEADGTMDDDLNHGRFADAERQLTVTVTKGAEQVVVILTLSPRILDTENG